MKKLLICMLSLLFASVSFAQVAGKDITVISREAGSGTRTAFIELTGVEVSANGKKTDQTTRDAIIANQTEVMMSSVAGNPYAVGYISLGSLNNTVKALSLDGVAPTVDNIKKGSYKLARPFNITLSTKAGAAAQDFVDFIMSAEGQKVISNGYIPTAPDAKAFSSKKPSGRITVAGSSSVTPVMEKLQEAYSKINPALKVEIQTSDSSTGMQQALNGTCDVGMASRALNAKELASLKPIEIAIDGIAVIINKENATNSLTAQQLKDIYTGKTTKW